MGERIELKRTGDGSRTVIMREKERRLHGVKGGREGDSRSKNVYINVTTQFLSVFQTLILCTTIGDEPGYSVCLSFDRAVSRCQGFKAIRVLVVV